MPRTRAPKDDRPQKVAKNSKQHKKQNSGMQLMQVKPKTYAQGEIIQAFYENHLLLHGPAGTGKTFIPMYLALREILEEGARSPYRKIVVIRSVVATRDMGHLPGTKEEKMAPYETPYREISNELCMRGDAYDLLKQKGIIEFECTGYLRGTTIKDAIIIVDEAQNCSEHELDTIITRVGENSKIVLCGDYNQSDLRGKEKEGFKFVIGVLQTLSKFESVQFAHADIVRSEFVKSYIIARDEARAKQ